MGRRARARGIANRAVRAARAATMARDQEAQEVAQHVYNVAVMAKTSPLPLNLHAPLQTAAEFAARPVALMQGMEDGTPEFEAMRQDVANYLMEGFVNMMVEFNPEHFEAWRQRLAEAEAG